MNGMIQKILWFVEDLAMSVMKLSQCKTRLITRLFWHLQLPKTLLDSEFFWSTNDQKTTDRLNRWLPNRCHTISTGLSHGTVTSHYSTNHSINMFKSFLTRKTATSVARVALSITERKPLHLRSIHIERRIEELNIELPTAPLPKANYNIVCITGDTLYVSGHLPIKVRPKDYFSAVESQ